MQWLAVGGGYCAVAAAVVVDDVAVVVEGHQAAVAVTLCSVDCYSASAPPTAAHFQELRQAHIPYTVKTYFSRGKKKNRTQTIFKKTWMILFTFLAVANRIWGYCHFHRSYRAGQGQNISICSFGSLPGCDWCFCWSNWICYSNEKEMKTCYLNGLLNSNNLKATHKALICYLAFVRLFLAAISLAVSGSGNEVGRGKFCVAEKEKPLNYNSESYYSNNKNNHQFN